MIGIKAQKFLYLFIVFGAFFSLSNIPTSFEKSNVSRGLASISSEYCVECDWGKVHASSMPGVVTVKPFSDDLLGRINPYADPYGELSNPYEAFYKEGFFGVNTKALYYQMRRANHATGLKSERLAKQYSAMINGPEKNGLSVFAPPMGPRAAHSPFRTGLQRRPATLIGSSIFQ